MNNNYEFKNEEVPEIVNKKCNEAYEMIYKEFEQRKKRKNISFKKGMAIAACAAVISVAAVPVAATYIPSIRNAFEYISHETYTKNPAEKNDLTKYATPVNESKSDNMADMTLQSVYCDGTNLAVSLALTPKNEKLQNTTAINGKLNITLDGKELIEEPEHRILGFVLANDGNYYCVLNFQNLNVTAESELKINVYELEGVNGYVRNWVENEDGASGTYVPQSTGAIDGKYDFEYIVTPDTSNNKTYMVNETQGGITLESVTITPFMTSLSINGLDEHNLSHHNLSLRIVDQDGNELEFLGNGNWDCVSPLKTAKKLYVEIFRLDKDNFPTEYSFEVEIEKGFADKYTVEYEIDQSKITYNPPYEELEAEYMNLQQNKFNEVKETVVANPVGTPIEIRNETYSMNMTVTGSEIAEISDYDIYEMDFGSTDDTKLLLITYEVENPENIAKDEYFQGFEVMTRDLDIYDSLGEPDYCSYRENGGKAANKYHFEPNETKTITHGYIVSEEQIENGFYVIASEIGYGMGVSPEKILSGDFELYEIE